MKVECTNGHTENASWDDIAERIREEDYSCKECNADVTVEIDGRFATNYNLGVDPV